MNDPFMIIQSLLNKIIDNEELTQESFPLTEDCHQRVLGALFDYSQNPGKVGVYDFAVLLRQFLREEEESRNGNPQVVNVPNTSFWPQRELWESCGVNIIGDYKNSFLIQAEHWTPDWLSDCRSHSIERSILRKEIRRNTEEIEGDPFLEKFGFMKYSCTPQRTALISILTMPQGSTLVINLPTGSGKSLCAYLPALLKSRDYGVSIIVVPTTALAIDQERNLQSRNLINHPTAYYGGNGQVVKERNEAIRARIKDGTQKIIFTSPESLMKSLRNAVYKASQSNLLRYFVIDEAHIINEWGDDFRPEFQEIAGLRRELLEISHEPFRTLLMSATITESCLNTLETLFGKPGPFDMLASVQIRPEPSYWFAYSDDEEKKENHIMESICHLPRPLILYVTKVEDANKWYRMLREKGFRRLDIMTGETPANERDKTINRWKKRETDVIVATSAFGLGVDHSDVRSVIHACIPESIDRYYQEVGRGGRDGQASLSLVIYTQGDIRTGKGMGQPRIITVEKGLERWDGMFHQKEKASDELYKIPVEITRGADTGINMENTKWNIRTLNLMSRAGLIELMGNQSPLSNDEIADLSMNEEMEESLNKYYEEIRKYRLVRILRQDHLQKSTWDELVEEERKISKREANRKSRMMEKVRKAKTCISEILSEVYEIHSKKEPSRHGANVSLSCGGCPYCRKNNISPYSNEMPHPRIVWESVSPFGGELQKLMGENNILLIFYEDLKKSDQMKRDFRKFVQKLVKWKVLNIIAPAEVSEEIREYDFSFNSFQFYFDHYELFKIPKLPTLIIIPSDEPLPTQVYGRIKYRENLIQNPPTIILLPLETKDPEKVDCLLRDITRCRHFLFNEFKKRVGL